MSQILCLNQSVREMLIAARRQEMLAAHLEEGGHLDVASRSRLNAQEFRRIAQTSAKIFSLLQAQASVLTEIETSIPGTFHQPSGDAA